MHLHYIYISGVAGRGRTRIMVWYLYKFPLALTLQVAINPLTLTVLFLFPHDVSTENCQHLRVSACGEGGLGEKRWLLFASSGRGSSCGSFVLSATNLVVTPDCICLLKNCRSLTCSWSFPHSCPTGHQWAGLLLSSSPQLKAVISFPSPLIWERRKHIFSIRRSHWKCLLQAAALLLPPQRSSCRFVSPTHPKPPHPPPCTARGKREVVSNFKYFYPLYSAADLFAMASGVLIGKEEFSLAGNQDICPEGV